MSDVLLQADKIAGQDRSRDYGHPHPNHERIAWMWNAYFQSRGFRDRVTTADVPLMMILLKIARHVHSPKFDNLLDIAGYTKCAAMIDDCESARRNGLNGPPQSNEGDLTDAQWLQINEDLNGVKPPINDEPASSPVCQWEKACGACGKQLSSSGWYAADSRSESGVFCFECYSKENDQCKTVAEAMAKISER